MSDITIQRPVNEKKSGDPQSALGRVLSKSGGNWKRLVVLLLPLMFSVSESLAQSGGFSGSFTRMGLGPRGMAMGNALGTVSQEGVFAHYNPALAAYVEKRNADMSTALMSFDRNLHALNLVFALPPSAGLNVGLLNANVYDIDGRTSSGYHTDYLSTHEFQFFAAFGIRLSSRLRLGSTVKINVANFHDDVNNSASAGFDVGVIYELSSSWRAGFSVHDLLSEYSWNTDPLYGTEGGQSQNNPFPVRYRFSSSYTFSDWNLLLSSEYEIQVQSAEYQRLQVMSGTIPPRNTTHTEEVTTESRLFRIGTAWLPHERVTLRAGWEVMDLDFLEETHKISAGFSVHLPYDALQPSFDYAYVREPFGISGMHVLALRLSL